MLRKLREGLPKPFQSKKEFRQGRGSSHKAPQPSKLGRATDEHLGSISESPRVPEEVRIEMDADWISDDEKIDDEQSEALVSQSTTAGVGSGAGSSIDGTTPRGDLQPKILDEVIDDDQLERDYEVKVRQRLLAMMKKAGALDDDTSRSSAQPPSDHSQLVAKIQDRLDASDADDRPNHPKRPVVLAGATGDLDDHPKRLEVLASANDVIDDDQQTVHVDSETDDDHPQTVHVRPETGYDHPKTAHMRAEAAPSAISLPISEQKRVEAPAYNDKVPFHSVLHSALEAGTSSAAHSPPAFDSSCLPRDSEDVAIPTVSRAPKAKARAKQRVERVD